MRFIVMFATAVCVLFFNNNNNNNNNNSYNNNNNNNKTFIDIFENKFLFIS